MTLRFWRQASTLKCKSDLMANGLLTKNNQLPELGAAAPMSRFPETDRSRYSDRSVRQLSQFGGSLPQCLSAQSLH